jgi:hypothetical protein
MDESFSDGYIRCMPHNVLPRKVRLKDPNRLHTVSIKLMRSSETTLNKAHMVENSM